MKVILTESIDSQVLKPCECGCNILINKINSRGQKARYVSGHNKRGHQNPNWRGGRKITSSGYAEVFRPNHKFANILGYVREHRIIWEEHNKATLLPWAEVHHKDENKLNNNIENLEAMCKWQHSKLHFGLKIRDDKRKCFLMTARKRWLEKMRHVG